MHYQSVSEESGQTSSDSAPTKQTKDNLLILQRVNPHRFTVTAEIKTNFNPAKFGACI